MPVMGSLELLATQEADGGRSSRRRPRAGAAVPRRVGGRELAAVGPGELAGDIQAEP